MEGKIDSGRYVRMAERTDQRRPTCRRKADVFYVALCYVVLFVLCHVVVCHVVLWRVIVMLCNVASHGYVYVCCF